MNIVVWGGGGGEAVDEGHGGWKRRRVLDNCGELFFICHLSFLAVQKKFKKSKCPLLLCTHNMLDDSL